jgi:hypothetical protein
MNNDKSWFFNRWKFHFRFGIPLFDEQISEVIRNGIVKHKLCAKDK